MATDRRITRAAGLIAALTMVSRILGFVRESLAGRLFTRLETDAYFAAFAVPDFMYYLLVGGALSAAFIPVFTEYLAKGEEKEGWRAASTFMNTVTVLLIVLAGAGIIFAGPVGRLEAPAFQGAKLILVSQLTRIMFSSVAMLAMAGLLMGVLYSYQSFFTPALGPVVYNVGIIAGAFFLGSRYGIKGMAAGVVAGAAGSLGLQVWTVWRRHPAYSPLIFDFRHPGFVRMLWLLLPSLFGLSATQLNILFTNMMASGLPAGSISALRWANRLIQLPLGIFAAAIGTAFFPAMARAVAEKRMDAYRETFSQGLRAILFITVPSAVGLAVLRYPIVRLLFQGQRFTAADTNLTAYALAFYCLGLFAHASILLLPRAFYSLQDTKSPVLVTASTVAISLGLNLVFLRYTRLLHGGMALSFSIMGLLNMGALLFLLRRKVGRIGGRSILRGFVLSLMASMAMGLAVYGVDRLLAASPLITGRRPVLEAGMEVAAGLAVGLAVYGGIAYLLRMEEMDMLIGLVRRRLKKRAAPEGAS
ncbi:MAG: murein biosynthesis integral membrane protein MurJ [Patescibacteria group bacterium]